MISIGKLMKKTLHLQVYEIVKKKIISGEFELGSRIVESKIGEEFGISNSPIREGLRMLQQEKFLVSTPAGLIVNPMEYAEMVHIHECRIALEPYAAKLAAEKISEENLKKLEYYLEEAKKYHRLNISANMIENNSSFHNLISNSCQNDYLISMINTITSLIILARVAETQYYRRADEYFPEHEKLLEALKNRDGNLAENILRMHVEKDLLFFKDNYEKFKKK